MKAAANDTLELPAPLRDLIPRAALAELRRWRDEQNEAEIARRVARGELAIPESANDAAMARLFGVEPVAGAGASRGGRR